MQEDQKPTMPTGEVENKKKATKLPLKANVTKRQFSVERPRDTVYAISVVSDAIREHMQAFVDENGGRKACCHRISIHENVMVYELRDVQSCPQCAFKPLNPTNRDIPAHPTFSPDAA